ncbi:MAG: HAD family hydrolase [Armatimonadota bacterium]
MIRVVVSDLGNVILRYNGDLGWHRILKACAYKDGAAQQFSRIFNQLGYGRGLADSREFFRRVKDALGLEMAYEEFCTAWSDVFEEERDVIELILSTNAESKYILSNTNDIHWRWIEARYPHVLSRFDGIVVSHLCGMEKPHADIYLHVARLTGRRPEEHLFIDDLEDNVKGARRVGFDAVLHTGYDALRAELAKRGLLSTEPVSG